MPDLVVTRGLPNPAGKDRLSPYAPSDEQLNGEWIEFANPGDAAVPLTDVSINHYTFDRGCTKTGEDRLMTFAGALAVGRSVRIHTGRGEPWDEGTIRHLYAARGNYVWNNVCGDTAVLRNGRGEWIDWASYEPQPPEGIVLNRIPGTNKLSAWRSARTA